MESNEEPVLYPVEAQIDVENENRDKSEAVADEEMVNVEIIDENLENEPIGEKQLEAVKEMGTRESEQVFEE